MSDENLPYAKQVDKQPTAKHERFAQWVEENSGYVLDAKDVQMVLTLYPKFQVSPANERPAKAKAGTKSEAPTEQESDDGEEPAAERPEPAKRKPRKRTKASSAAF